MRLSVVFFLLLVLAAPLPALAQQGSATDLAGLWEAKLRFGPDIRGPLILEHAAGAWRAEIAGGSVGARVAGCTITVTLPDGGGGFRGHLTAGRGRIVGHWIQAITVTNGSRFASPVTLTRARTAERWQG